MATVTRASLAEHIHMKIGLSRQESAHFLENVLEHISLALEQGDTVKISGFGTFMVRRKKERIGRNPKTKEEVPIQARSVLIFRASQLMKSYVNDALTSSAESVDNE